MHTEIGNSLAIGSGQSKYGLREGDCLPRCEDDSLEAYLRRLFAKKVGIKTVRVSQTRAGSMKQ